MVRSINLYKNFNIKTKHKGSIILVGNFDGLHLVHQKLFRLARNFKKKYSTEILHHIKKKFNLPDEFMLNVGTIETRKNLIAIINAMTKMKHDIPLVVIGRKTKYMNFIKVQFNVSEF